MEKINAQGKDSENLWLEIRGAIKIDASNIQKVPKKRGSVWITAETLMIIEERRLKKLEGNLIDVRRLNAEIQRWTRQDKEKYYSKKCNIIEINKLGKTRGLFQEITGQPKINTGVLKSKMNKEEIEKDCIIKRRKEYTEELYMNDQEMEREFVELPYQDEATVIRCEVEKALKETVGRKAVGVDELQIELL